MHRDKARLYTAGYTVKAVHGVCVYVWCVYVRCVYVYVCVCMYVWCVCVLDWDSFVPEAAEFWRIVNTDWLDFPGRLLVVHYEQLVHSLNSTLSDILHFLNITHTASDLQCAATHSRGDFKRQEPREGRENILAKRFSSKHREFIHRCGMAVATKLSDTGHGHLPYSLVTPLYRMENTRATGNYPGRT